MLVLSCSQIFMRAVTGGSMLWIDPLLRYLVLWSGLFGAVMATMRGKHIAIDMASLILPKYMKKFINLLVLIFSTLTAAALTWAAVSFLRSEIEFGGPGLLDLPSWQWNLVFPVAFALMTIIYLVQTCRAICRLWYSF